MARHFVQRPHLRFIEFMTSDSNGWRLDDVVPCREVIRRIDAEMPLEAVEPNYSGRWRSVALPRRQRQIG